MGICLAFALAGRSQAGSSPGLKTFVPPSPNATALGKYGEVPVSLYTGIPDISVPLYTVKGRVLEVPVSINYHAGGIRVEEIASLVGIGWSLNAGGVITRTVRGMPDDVGGGYFQGLANANTLGQKYLNNLSPINSLQTGVGNGTNTDMNVLESIRENIQDGEPDIFYYNFGKYSGRFFMNQQGQFVCSPLKALKIQYSLSSNNFGRVEQWILTTPDGVRYIFGTSLDGTHTAFENNSTRTPWPVTTTGWYLMSIYSPENDSVIFNYTNISYSNKSRSSEVLNQPISGSTGLPFKDNVVALNNMSVPRLTSIIAANTTLTFGAGPARTDLPGEAALGNITISNNNNPALTLKQWQFYYDYSTNRLTLDSLKEFSADGTVKGLKYLFAYNGSLPDPNPEGTAINSQDLWGYYNGVPNTVFPQGFVATGTPWGTITVNGADRHSDTVAMKAGILTQITYPTGGTTTFNYESNTVYMASGDNSVPQQGIGEDAFVVFTPYQTKADTFTIQYPDPNTHIAQLTGEIHTMDHTCPFDNDGFSQCYSAWLVGINGTQFGPQYFKEGNISANLPAGTYRIVGQGTGSTSDTNNIIHFELSWTEYPPATQSPLQPVNKVVGGLRIKRIINSDGVNNTVTRYLYNNFSDTSSSGVLVNMPYNYVNLFNSWPATGSPSLYFQVKGFPLIPLIPTQGAPIGYKNVTRLSGEYGENGKEEYTYTTANDFPDEIKNYRPYPPSCSFDWRRGQLLKTTTYKNTGSGFSPIQYKASNYISGVNQSVAYGLNVDIDDFAGPGGITPSLVAGDYFAGGYRTIGEFLYLQSDTTVLYDQVNPAVYSKTVTSYSYDTLKAHYQLTSKVTTNSKNQIVETDYKYPPDLTLTGYQETARQNLVAQYILDPVLDQKTIRNGVQINDTKNNYMAFPDGFTLPESVEEQIAANPSEKRVTYNKYDAYGNLQEEQKVNDVPNTYIWDYNHHYPIAKVINATADQVAYTSFEADGGGGWTISSPYRYPGAGVTGNQYYQLPNGAISRSGLTPSKTYIVSYWSYTGSPYTVSGSTGVKQGKTSRYGFTYFEHTVTGVSTVSVTGSGPIDELRLYPSNAQMTSFSYTPLLGLTSQCDEASRITYYDYDGIGRLMDVKDQDLNVIKTYDYHYHGN